MVEKIKDHLKEQYGFSDAELDRSSVRIAIHYVASFYISELEGAQEHLVQKSITDPAKAEENITMTKGELALLLTGYAVAYHEVEIVKGIQANEVLKRELDAREEEIEARRTQIIALKEQYAEKLTTESLNDRAAARFTQLLENQFSNANIKELVKQLDTLPISQTTLYHAAVFMRNEFKKVLA